MACAFCAAYLCIWSAYGFRFDAIPGRNQSLLFDPLPLMENPLANYFVSIIRQYRLLPKAWLYGQLYLFNVSEATSGMGI
jgi:hypothetical protein